MDDWESAADQEPVIRPKLTDVNKWLGEDEEEVKDSWEEDEEKKDEEKHDAKPEVSVPVKTKPNKALKAKLEEQERLEMEKEELKLANMTPEEKSAEKLRLRKIQEESDLKSALETFGVKSLTGGLDAFVPVSKEEFKEFGTALSLKISQYKQSPHFPQFVEELVRSICVNLSAADMKKCKICIENLHTEKLKMEKQTAKKPSGKGKTKVSLRKDNTAIENFEYTNDYDDFDDFM